MGWFAETFNEDYLAIYSHRNEVEARKQISFLLDQLPLRENCRVLDLACGNGRHAIVLSKLGFQVIGLDLSGHLLKEAKFSADRETSSIPFVCADMRAIPFKNNSFDLILSMFTSFGYFDSDRENESVIFSAARLLKAGCLFVLDYLNPNWVKAQLKPETKRNVKGLKVIEKRRINTVTHRVEKDIYVEKGSEIIHYRESVRLYEYDELSKMFNSSGLKIVKTFGDYSHISISSESPRMIFVVSPT